jgi:hypothetical protein
VSIKSTSITLRTTSLWMLTALWLQSGSIALATEPSLTRVLPPGGQRGTEVDLVLEGTRLEDAAEVMWYEPGIAVEKIEFADKVVKAKIRIAADCRLGEHALRLRTPSGLSELRTFYVGALPTIAEQEPNSEFEKAQKITLNSTATGIIENEDIDYFAVEAKKDERIVVVVEGVRLGRTLFDPSVVILDDQKRELAKCDDHPLVRQDCIVGIVAPADGRYVVQLRDCTFAGNGNCSYRMYVGTFPQPATVLPLGGKPGEEVEFRFLGDIGGEFVKKIKLPTAVDPEHRLFIEDSRGINPAPIPVRVVDLSNVLESSEPHGNLDQATPFEIPSAVNGVLAKPGEQDFYRFKAEKGKVFDIRCHARKLGSPIDPVIELFTGENKHLTGNDDSPSPDSQIRFTVPADGEYKLQIRDQLNRGGPTFTYRIEIAPVTPAVAVTIPKVQQFSQDRQTIVVARGNRFATRVGVDRQDIGGDMTIAAQDLPPGVTASGPKIAGGQNAAPMLFEAAADAPIGGVLATLNGRFTDPNQSLVGNYRQRVELVLGDNQTVFWTYAAPKLAVVVTEEAPFKLQIVEPKVPLVAKGSMQVKIVAERKEDFKSPITVELIHNAPNVTNASNVVIPEGQTEVLFPLNANNAGAADYGKHPFVAMGQAPVKGGTVWVASQMATLDVAAPFLEFTLNRAAAEQGQSAEIVCKVKQNTPFEGAAKASLFGLPNKVTTSELDVSKDSTELVFPIKIDAESPVGKHKSVGCQVVITQNGEPIVHNVGTTELRIDPPSPPKAAKTEKVAKPTEPQPKQLSRLEKLRAEAQQNEAK